MQLVVEPNGQVRCIYGEAVDLTRLGRMHVVRASHVDPARDGWTADLRPVGGAVLGPFPCRSTALAAELAWLERHWLAPTPSPSHKRNNHD